MRPVRDGDAPVADRRSGDRQDPGGCQDEHRSATIHGGGSPAGRPRSMRGMPGRAGLRRGGGVARGRGGRLVRPAVRVADDLVVHRAALGDEARLLDRARDLRSLSRKCEPAAETTFSSIIRLPKSFAPKRSETWPIFAPCVTHEAWTFGKLSRNTRATASVRRYWNEVSSSPASAVFSGWKVQPMNAVKPPVRSCRSRRCSRCSIRSSSVSTWPNIIVAVVLMPRPCAFSITSSHSAVEPLRDPDHAAHAVGQDLRPAAGNRVEAGRHQPPQRRLERQLRDAGDVLHLGRREPVDPDRVARLDPAEQLLVVLDAEVRVQAALQQDLPAAERDASPRSSARTPPSSGRSPPSRACPGRRRRRRTGRCRRSCS